MQLRSASPVAPGAGRAQRATGSSRQRRPNSATDMGHACPRSLRAFAQNDQQKTAPVHLNLCPHARAEASGGNNRERPARSAASRRCEAARRRGRRSFRFSEMVVGRQIVVLRFGRRWSLGGDRRSEVGIAGRPRRRASAASYRVIDVKAGQILQRDMGHAWLRSRRAFALNDQQKTAPVYFNLCPHARARGERRQ